MRNVSLRYSTTTIKFLYYRRFETGCRNLVISPSNCLTQGSSACEASVLVDFQPGIQQNATFDGQGMPGGAVT